MLSVTSNTPDLLARLSAMPAAVQQALARASVPGQAKANAVAALARRAGARRLQPDRQAALAWFAKPEADSADTDPAALQPAVVQAVLAALGRS